MQKVCLRIIAQPRGCVAVNLSRYKKTTKRQDSSDSFMVEESDITDLAQYYLNSRDYIRMRLAADTAEVFDEVDKLSPEVLRDEVDRLDQYIRKKDRDWFKSDDELLKIGQKWRRLLYLLDIKHKSQSRPESHRGWGELSAGARYSSKQAAQIMNTGAVIDNDQKMTHKFCLTLTLPGGTEKAIVSLAKWSGYMANRMTQACRNMLARKYKDCECYWFYVWEFQKRGALHVHWLLAAESEDMVREISSKIKDSWFGGLMSIGSKERTDMFERVDGGTWRDDSETWQWHLHKITKSVTGYFAKYASKIKSKSSVEPKYAELCPHRYWSSSYALKQRVRDQSFSYSITPDSHENANQMFENIVDFIERHNPFKTLSGVFSRVLSIGDDGNLVSSEGGEAGLIKRENEVFRIDTLSFTSLFESGDYASVLESLKGLNQHIDCPGNKGVDSYLGKALNYVMSGYLSEVALTC